MPGGCYFVLGSASLRRLSQATKSICLLYTMYNSDASVKYRPNTKKNFTREMGGFQMSLSSWSNVRRWSHIEHTSPATAQRFRRYQYLCRQLDTTLTSHVSHGHYCDSTLCQRWNGHHWDADKRLNKIGLKPGPRCSGRIVTYGTLWREPERWKLSWNWSISS